MTILLLLSIALIVSIFIGLTFLTGLTLTRIILFTGDKFMVFIGASYFAHQNFSIRFASGKAVYFWNILGGLIAVVFYTCLFRTVYNRFNIIGKLVNLVISYISAAVVYITLITIFTGGSLDFLPLLNNQLANNIVNYILIGIIAIIVWVKREESLEFL